MANCAHTPSLAAAPPDQSATRDDFDQALTQAQTITLIISYLADVNGIGNPSPATFGWLADELNERLERIEVADMTMRKARA